MEAGKPGKFSPIVDAIARAESQTTGEIRVHLSKSRLEKDPYQRAAKIFQQFGMTRTAHRNAVLLYINPSKRHFAIIGDEGIHHVVGQRYWESLARKLREHLQSTHLENAVALAVESIGEALRKFFPLAKNSMEGNPDELPNDVTTD